MRLLKFLKRIRRSFVKYNPSVEVLIYEKRLLGNLKEYQNKYPEFLSAPVLKSNAYGHGLVPIAQILDGENIAFFVLDSLYEAMILRNNGIKSEILIIGYTQPENIKSCRLIRISFAITSLEQLKEVAEMTKSKIKIHLKIDTGMHRQGVAIDQINEAIDVIKSNGFLILEGICSHFADADNADRTFTESQIKKWNGIVPLFKENFQTIKFTHIGATAGAFYSGQTEGDTIRLGLGLYGMNSSPFDKLNLKPVLQMQSIITSVKKLRAGEYVGYSATYKAKKDMAVATVPVGYFEGVDRRLSNCGFFKISGNFCPIVGRVSMNITSIDMTSAPDAKYGDKIIVISKNKEDKNSVENIAEVTKTIPWEILVHIPEHLRRTVIKD